jgi:YegS/Rv2252/BmrU family lipid kinase
MRPAPGTGGSNNAPAPSRTRERRAVLIVNSRARRGERLYAEAKALLLKKGFKLAASHPVRDPARIPEIVKDAVEQGERMIVIGGGDGTISSIVDYLAYQNVVLGILPMGTANNFARGVGLPLDVREAVEVIAEGRLVTVDLGKLNNNYFTNAVSLGLSAAIHCASRDGSKRYLGRAGYLLAAVRSFATHRPFRCRLEHDGATTEIEALDLRVANGPYHGGMVAVPGADVESRDLVVRAIKGKSKWALVRVWTDIVRGRSLDPTAADILRVRALTITADPVQAVSIDGEVVTNTPVTISVASKALRLMAPQTGDPKNHKILPGAGTD